MHAEKLYFSQPLKERLRFFIRLEFLFRLANSTLHGDTVESSHHTLCTLLDIIGFVKQQDLKREVLKELDRVITSLTPLQESPDIEHGTLQQILTTLDDYRSQLLAINGPIGQGLRDNEFLKTVQQRKNIPGGLTETDPPVYHHWLLQPAEKRTEDLSSWLAEFELLQNSISLVLKLVRDSATPLSRIAESGTYKQSLDGSIPFQMIMVALPAGSPLFAEISGGKHRFNVRFMDSQAKPRPAQTTKDVEFELYCCAL